MIDILITEYIDQAAIDGLAAEFTLRYDPGLFARPDDIAAAAIGVLALIVRNRTQVRGATLAAFDGLRVIGRLGVGLDNIDLDACAARGIAVCPARGANAVSVAEYVIAAILIGLRPIWRAGPDVLAGHWPRNDLMFNEASGRRLGLIGFGDIAREVATRAAALGLEVIAHSRSAPAMASVRAVGLEELLATSDIVSLHAPLSPTTRNLLDAGAISRLKPGAILINTARGGMLDEAALAAGLRAGRIGAAFLDVFETEPLPAGSALRDVPNLYLTPHISGVTVEANRRVSAMTVENIRRVLRQAG